MRINPLLLMFAIVYCFLSYLLVAAQRNDNDSNSLGYVYFFPALFLVGGIVLWFLFKVADLKVTSVFDWILLIFSTPIATIIIMAAIPKPYEIVTTNFRKQDHLGKKVVFNDSNGKLERVEFYKSKETLNAESTFPTSDNWIKDSVWTYYNNDGSIKKKIRY
jgi:hypothetical protein